MLSQRPQLLTDIEHRLLYEHVSIEPEFPTGVDAVHLILTGLSGTGKSTVATLINMVFNTMWPITKYNTRPPRNGEGKNRETRHVDLDELRNLLLGGKLLNWSLRETVHHDGSRYYRALPAPEYWQVPSPETEVKLSVLGPRTAIRLVQEYQLNNVVPVYLTGSDRVLLPRIADRVAQDRVLHYKAKNRLYRDELQIHKEYEGHVIDVDEKTQEEVYLEVLQKLKLPLRPIS